MLGCLWQGSFAAQCQQFNLAVPVYATHGVIFRHENPLTASMGAALVCDWVGHGGIVGRDSGWQFVAMNIDFIKGEKWGTELQSFWFVSRVAAEAMTWKRYDLSKPGSRPSLVTMVSEWKLTLTSQVTTQLRKQKDIVNTSQFMNIREQETCHQNGIQETLSASKNAFKSHPPGWLKIAWTGLADLELSSWAMT